MRCTAKPRSCLSAGGELWIVRVHMPPAVKWCPTLLGPVAVVNATSPEELVMRYRRVPRGPERRIDDGRRALQRRHRRDFSIGVAAR
jgi:hypothetical protein